MIVGIDEVGRGAWAGPLCVGAVALGETDIEGLTDSKKLTAKKRGKLSLEIRQKAAGVGLGWVSAKQIDRVGLSAALKTAAQTAMRQIHVPYDQIIIDGTVNLLHALFVQTSHENSNFDERLLEKVVTMKRADLLVPSVSAASIVAKVARDEYMKTVSRTFPGYGFETHVGYGTAAHMRAIAELGVTPIHRTSFAPLRKAFKNTITTESKKGSTFLPTKDGVIIKNTTATGNRAEDQASIHLVRLGYTILDRNWKTKWCEIDLIARRNGVVHFIEVKYRKNDRGGGGLAAITPKKLRQMKFAAELWLSRRDVPSAVLSAVEVSGNEFTITEFIEQI